MAVLLLIEPALPKVIAAPAWLLVSILSPLPSTITWELTAPVTSPPVVNFWIWSLEFGMPASVLVVAVVVVLIAQVTEFGVDVTAQAAHALFGVESTASAADASSATVVDRNEFGRNVGCGRTAIPSPRRTHHARQRRQDYLARPRATTCKAMLLQWNQRFASRCCFSVTRASHASIFSRCFGTRIFPKTGFHGGCRHPRKRVIQYSRDVSDGIEKPRRTGYPAGAFGLAEGETRWRSMTTVGGAGVPAFGVLDTPLEPSGSPKVRPGGGV